MLTLYYIDLMLRKSGHGTKTDEDPVETRKFMQIDISHDVVTQNQTVDGVKNSRPSFSPDRHTSRHRRGVFGGTTKVNSAGTAFVPEIDTHAPPADRLFSMPRSHGESSSNFSLTV
jgi:hypothetical protein